MEDEALTSIVVVEGDMAGRRLTDRSLRLSLGQSSGRSGSVAKKEVNFGEVLSPREILMRDNAVQKKDGDDEEITADV